MPKRKRNSCILFTVERFGCIELLKLESLHPVCNKASERKARQTNTQNIDESSINIFHRLDRDKTSLTGEQKLETTQQIFRKTFGK